VHFEFLLAETAKVHSFKLVIKFTLSEVIVVII
jgi:hypothetical protein